MKITGIQYCHSTINGSSGCDGCELWNTTRKSCFAGRLHVNRLAYSMPEIYAPDFGVVKEIPGRFAQAASWGPPTAKENAEKPWLAGRPRHIFVGDMGDFLSAAVSDEFLTRELRGAFTSPAGKRHVWLLLTKRPDRLADLAERWGGLPPNVVAMTTITNQRTADTRIPHLLRTRCFTRGISAEPLLEHVRLPLETGGLHWVIAGGESGPGCRPTTVDSVRSLRDHCADTNVAFFFKQRGGVSKANTGRTLDGRTYDGMPDIPALKD